MDTSPEKFYDSLLDFEAAAEEATPFAEPPPIEEPEEVPPEDYKVHALQIRKFGHLSMSRRRLQCPLLMSDHGLLPFQLSAENFRGRAAKHPRGQVVVWFRITDLTTITGGGGGSGQPMVCNIHGHGPGLAAGQHPGGGRVPPAVRYGTFQGRPRTCWTLRTDGRVGAPGGHCGP